MGLDMYVYAVTKAEAVGTFEMGAPEEEAPRLNEVFYWHTFYLLHNAMFDLAKQKGWDREPDEFNCACVQLTAFDLDWLEITVPEDADILAFLEKARLFINAGSVLYYTADL